MECLHGKTAACSTTKHGTFWFCEQRPSCEFFCSDEDCYMYTKAVAAFRESGCLHPVCPTHQKLAKLRMVKDKMKQSILCLCRARKSVQVLAVGRCL